MTQRMSQPLPIHLFFCLLTEKSIQSPIDAFENVFTFRDCSYPFFFLRRVGFLSLFLSVTLIVWRKKGSYHWTSDIEIDARVRRSSTPTPYGRVLEAIKFSFSFKAIELI